MGKTIIQTIGPLYGEVTNGTVFGRPNGSVYVPSQNTISATIPDDRKYIRNSGEYLLICTNAGIINYGQSERMHVVAQSQDIANYIMLEISDVSDFSNIIGTENRNAGTFNDYVMGAKSETVIVSAKTYYIRFRLMSATAVPVATSDVIEVTGWVSE